MTAGTATAPNVPTTAMTGVSIDSHQMIEKATASGESENICQQIEEDMDMVLGQLVKKDFRYMDRKLRWAVSVAGDYYPFGHMSRAFGE